MLNQGQEQAKERGGKETKEMRTLKKSLDLVKSLFLCYMNNKENNIE